MKTKSILSTLGAIVSLYASPSLNAQGPLTPPGPPSPMFKTLEQIEPRRPISSLPFNITQPGSYYVTTNLVGAAGQNGITINSDCVTIDLMGFELRGLPGSLSGVFFNGQFRAYIYNGCIRNWSQDGINGNNGAASIIERLRVGDCGRNGIAINSGSQIRHCIVSGNSQVGILTSNHVEVDDCVSGGNGTHGIQCGTGSNIRRCLTTGNGAAGITGSGLDGFNILDSNSEANNAGIAIIGQAIVKNSFARSNRVAGISVGDGSSVIGCSASDNGTAATPAAHGIQTGQGCTVRDCTTRNNGGDGINSISGSTVANNTCRENRGDNIEVSGDCLVTGNACDSDIIVSLSGIRVTSSNNRVENNNLTENLRGLFIVSSGNVVLHNSVVRNTTNYVIAAGNDLNLLLGQIPETIPWPASIELAGSLRGTSGQNGITITTNDVTIDLKGHSLIGVAGSLAGILVTGNRTNIVLHNGTVRSWGSDGIQANTSYNSSFGDLRLANNGANGLRGGNGAVIKCVTARANGGDGINTASGCVISDSAAAENRSDGIVASTGTTVSGCSAYNNSFNGISASTGSTVINCTAYSNTNGISASSGSTVTSCTAASNATNGIVAAFGTTINGCTVRANRTGINAGDDCNLINNACDGNTAQGILCTGSDNRVDNNKITDSTVAIRANPATDNFIVRNTATGAAAAYDIAAGNTYGQILVPGAAFVASNPWANFAY